MVKNTIFFYKKFLQNILYICACSIGVSMCYMHALSNARQPAFLPVMEKQETIHPMLFSGKMSGVGKVIRDIKGHPSFSHYAPYIQLKLPL